ncbi:MAG: hypothetical protein C0506_07650 [Anaerolinea sp.]|nr:hypothetical protein [Anaerolinea sp.]
MNPNEPLLVDDLYETLQVAPSASPEVVEAAYHGLTKKYGSDPDPAVREQRRDLDRAYEVLSDASRRADYDRSRMAGRAAAPVSTAQPTAPPANGEATVAVKTWPKGVVTCPRDPGVETALRCSRCETPICPKCLIQTPVGARCRDCARMTKSPVYTVSNATMVRAALASVVGGVAMGLIWGLVLLPFSVGFFSIFVGAGLGYAFTRMMEFATGRKRGPVIVAFAVFGIGIAWAMQLLFVDVRIAMYGLVAAGVAVYFAYQNLR